MRVRLIELASLFEHHHAPLDRLLAVASRVAAVTLPPSEAGKVAGWFDRLREGDR